MSDLGLAGTQQADPLTFIVTLGGFVPSAFSILQVFCWLLGLVLVADALIRQIGTVKGRNDYTGSQNFMHALYGAAIGLTAEIIGAYGKGVFGEFESASVLLYVAKEDGSMAKVATAAFLSLVQFLGALAVLQALRVSDRLSTGKPRQGDTWAASFFFFSGGLACVFIQQSIGLVSALSGLPLSRFINNL